MPRTPKLCGRPGKPKCLQTATVRGRCTDHQIAPFAGAKDRWKAERPKNYTALRNRVIREAKGLCELCGAQGAQVDHLKPVAEGGSWARENLQLLCTPCHKIKSDEDAKRGKARRAR